MPRRTRRSSGRPLPIGAALLLLATAAVLVIIFWKQPGVDTAGEIVLPRSEVPGSEEGATTRRASFRDPFLQRVEAFLVDRRLRVAPGQRGIDLVCALPASASSFQINADLGRAVSYWGGVVAGASEHDVQKLGLVVDLRLSYQGRSCSLRLIRDPDAPEDPRIAIVIDDFGYEKGDLADAFLDLPFPITPSVLPGYARSAWTVRRAMEKGRPPILHLPMEPRGFPKEDPGPGAILVGMDRQTVGSVLSRNLRDLGGVVGISNHMGSRASEDPSIAGLVLGEVKARGFFYLDSGTSGLSVFPAEAARAGVRCLTADLFLDGEEHPTPETMGRRLSDARKLAIQNGSAILVGHARPATLAFLRSTADSLAAGPCRPVPLGDLLR